MTIRKVSLRAIEAVALGLIWSAAACASRGRPAGATTASSAAPPALIVLVMVDQLRPDYLDRYADQLSGGLGRLVQGGALFTNAVHDYATTETAPGHASTLSGRFPRNTGIVRNNRGVFDPEFPLIEATGDPASPRRFRGTTLVDWLIAANPSTKILSVSRKDRAAILSVGRSRQHVYWYATNGRFTTSTYYRALLPPWVQDFNARRLPHRTAGRRWDLLLPSMAYPEPEQAGRNRAFPYASPDDSVAAARSVDAYPWMDEITLELALAGLNALQLGDGHQTDLLAISLSSTDAIGHAFGPDSRELHDQILRLDRALGVFLDSLFVVRSPASVVIALTSDHGVGPNPELHFGRPGAGRTSLDTLVERYRRDLSARGLDRTTVAWESGMLFTNAAAFSRVGINMDSTLRVLAADARKVPGVLRADLVRDLPAADTVRDQIARRWYHALPPDIGVTLVVTLEPYYLWSSTSYATHGTPHDYDARVPIILYGPPFVQGRYDGPARVVDLAPTLAVIAGVGPAERLDGRVLDEALQSRSAKGAKAPK